MDSPQSVVSPFKNSSVFPEPEKPNTDPYIKNSGYLSKGIEVQAKEATTCTLEGFLGVLEVYIHQARDIHNICIYQKQDVYAKICLTSDPQNTVSTQIINGGGKNPVFNEHLQLNVRTIDSSLKCEIWMLSRVRNFLEDQLLGFALVPMSEILLKNGALDKEFSLSSTDLFHSPAGFVQLSLSYKGDTPDVMVISKPPIADAADVEISASLSNGMEKIEFPDPNIVNENDMMVSEYFGIQCESSVSSDTEIHLNSKIDAIESVQISKQDSPPSSVSNNGSPEASPPASCHSSDNPRASQSPNQENFPLPKEKNSEAGDTVSDASGGVPNTFENPVVTVKIEPEQNVVQQDYVDMYMKSMQQFTESLAKMKLPLDIESGPASSGDTNSDKKSATPKSNGSRVFYGSRAFF